MTTMQSNADTTVSVIVLNWNGKANTLACLASLSRVTHPVLDVIVVDNGSTDGSDASIRAAFPEVTLLQTGANLGYTGGNNHGIAYFLEKRDHSLVVLLNNDTLVDPLFLERLVLAADQHPEAGVFGPKILYQSDPRKVWYAGGQWDAATSTFVNIGQGEPDSERFSITAEVDFINGCVLMTRRELLMQIGGLDDRYFLTFEENDFCTRAREHGQRCLYVHDAVVWHKVSASFGGSTSALGSYFWSRNRLLFAEIHMSISARLSLMGKILLEALFPRLIYGACPGVSPARRLYWLLRKGEAFDFANYADPYYKARIFGIRDYLLRRFGDCSPRLRDRLLSGAGDSHAA